ncbi:MAG: pilus assembly protein N-terminal domain-containing protein, partial [Candidatus Omnitrophica bacterium]|nr:pilus assembly protein N-terminal domain-containing protein [Candidatus Omnitrophota bacterium]
MARKILIWLFIIAFLNSYIQPLYAQNLVPEFLCELGLKAYKQGNIPEALGEFNKALIANPTYAPAREYIRLIRRELARRQGLGTEEVPAVVKPLPEPKVKAPVVLPKAAPQKAVTLPTAPVERSAPVAKLAPVVKPLPVAKPAPVAQSAQEAAKPVVKTVEAPALPAAAPRTVPVPAPVVPASVAPVAVKAEPVAAPYAPVVPGSKPLSKEETAAMEKTMKQLEYLSAPLPVAPAPKALPVIAPKPVVQQPTTSAILQQAKAVQSLPSLSKQKLLPSVLLLDEAVRNATGALELEQGREIIIRGLNIQRYLVTQPSVLDVHKQGADDLLAKADNFGYTYLHVWDNSGRWTLEFLTVPVKPEGPTYEELLRRSEERAGTFKLRYAMDWNTTETGRGVGDLKRSSYSYGHYLTLTGPTPYGDVDSSASIQTSQVTTDLNYFTAGLTNGRLGPFEGFSLRAVDYSPPITNLEFSAPTLRGVMLSSPAFDKKIEYTTFWGREGGGRYGALSPGLNKIKSSFISGMDINYFPSKKQNYGFSVFRGWGRDRADNLNTYGYDAHGEWRFNRLNLEYETGYDSENLAHLFTAKYELPKLKFTNEFRNTAKNFLTMTGSGWRVGEIGDLINVEYTPTKDIDINSRLDVYQDRLFPNPGDPDRWNTDLRTDLAWRLNEVTSLRSDYTYQNDTGRIAPFRSQSVGTGLYRSFERFRRMTAYVNFRHQDDTHFNSPNLDFTDDKATAGMRVNLYKEIYYYIAQEYNWLLERASG